MFLYTETKEVCVSAVSGIIGLFDCLGCIRAGQSGENDRGKAGEGWEHDPEQRMGLAVRRVSSKKTKSRTCQFMCRCVMPNLNIPCTNWHHAVQSVLWKTSACWDKIHLKAVIFRAYWLWLWFHTVQITGSFTLENLIKTHRCCSKFVKLEH